MTIIIEATPRSVWRRGIFPGLTLAFGLALAVGAAGIQASLNTPALSGSKTPLSAASEAVRRSRESAVVYIVDSREAALELESVGGGRQTSVLVAETEPSVQAVYEAAYEAWSLVPAEASVWIIDLTGRSKDAHLLQRDVADIVPVVIFRRRRGGDGTGPAREWTHRRLQKSAPEAPSTRAAPLAETKPPSSSPRLNWTFWITTRPPMRQMPRSGS